MRDANYLRAQAELCFKLARQMSDRSAAENLRAEAAHYHAEAAEIELGLSGTKITPQRSGGRHARRSENQ